MFIRLHLIVGLVLAVICCLVVDLLRCWFARVAIAFLWCGVCGWFCRFVLLFGLTVAFV